MNELSERECMQIIIRPGGVAQDMPIGLAMIFIILFKHIVRRIEEVIIY